MMNNHRKDVLQASILVVDDDPQSLRLLADMLTRSGYTVRPARDGNIALSSAFSAPPDLILLDIMMPGVDGYAVCEGLKADKRTCDIPVIFISALDHLVDKVKAFKVGGVDYITKPFQVEEVLARVRTHLEMRAMQQQLLHKNAQLRQEIVAREQAEAMLQEYARELEVSNADLMAFAHTVAHDLKNPLTALIAAGSVLERESGQFTDERRTYYFSLIVRNSRKMSKIIDDLLLLSRVRQVDELRTSVLDMLWLVSETRRRLSYMIEEYQPEIIVPTAWPKARGYGPWVEEVWVNYFSNALKYGGVPPRVELGFDVLGQGQMRNPESGEVAELCKQCAVLGKTVTPQVRFWVRDNGQGLTPEEQAKLFTQFTRLQEDRAEGYGLGLSIVRRIVEKLGGEVGVESQIGKGSTFFFTLPAA